MFYKLDWNAVIEFSLLNVSSLNIIYIHKSLATQIPSRLEISFDFHLVSAFQGKGEYK